LAEGRAGDSVKLTGIAREIRRIAVSLIAGAGSGHPGSCLSAADLLAALYFSELRIRPDVPQWPERDRFVLSKGHACPALYAALHLRGFFGADALGSFRQLDGMLQGSPTHSIPGVDATCGSLGQGFSIAIGMALGLRHHGREARVYVMLGDGELQEGEIWEGAMSAAHHRLSGLCAIIDYNKLQSDDLNANIMQLEPLKAKWESFNWLVQEVDGHDLPGILRVLAHRDAARPGVIIAHTTKGRGVSYMEGVPAWHGSVKMKAEELATALGDLGVERPDQSRYAFHG
jgi:transketolase